MLQPWIRQKVPPLPQAGLQSCACQQGLEPCGTWQQPVVLSEARI